MRLRSGGPGGGAPRVCRGVWGAARPPNDLRDLNFVSFPRTFVELNRQPHVERRARLWLIVLEHVLREMSGALELLASHFIV